MQKDATKKTLCLNMIVKNEAEIIVETLTHLCSHINLDYWVISDTGSTDKTKELIRGFFSSRKIPGELLEHAWQDFAYNRTKALEGAYNKTDYLFLFDADDRIEGTLILPNPMNKDSYYLKIGKDLAYRRKLLLTNRKKWMFKGVLHEVLEEVDTMNRGEETIQGDYTVISGHFGNRSKNANKYINDAIILKNAFHKEMQEGGENFLICRYAFYCARSYHDAGTAYYNDAIEWYKKVLELNNWMQEKYYSCYVIGNLYYFLNDTQNAVKYWIKSSDYDGERIEGIVDAMECLRNKGNHVMVNLLYNKFKNYKKKLSSDKLFVDLSKYNDLIEYNNSISAFYVPNEKQSGYECCKKIIMNKHIDESVLQSTVKNILFYKDFFNEKEEDTIRLFYRIDDILATHTTEINHSYFELWNTLFNRNRLFLTKAKQDIVIKKNSLKPKIFLSFTTCKRLDLFTQTLNSMLNHWTDIDQIDYWFCVDDNSSADERRKMKTLYPWIDYYMKDSLGEKGHRQSMNIIWEKINALKPEYWIHLEDDFLFHHKSAYITPSIEFLKTNTKNVKQVLFNRNYAETIENYTSKGHLPVNGNDKIILHHHKQGTFNYINHHYWAHYSFRPALIDVNTILKLGNYDSINQFFEADYAQKWTAAGYKSAFFNRITCRHIGRLTNDRTEKNAYELNKEEQFSNTKQLKEKLNLDTYIINLDRRTDRLDYLLENVPFEFQRFSAIDGKNLIKYKDDPILKELLMLKKNQLCVIGEVGCSLSHFSVWRKSTKPTIILEDNIMFHSDSLPTIKKTIENINLISNEEEWDIIYIAGQWTPHYGINSHSYINQQKINLSDVGTKFIPIDAKTNFYKRINNSALDDFWCNPFYRTTAGYIVSKKGAKKLTSLVYANMPNFMNTALDVWLLNMESQKNLIIYDAFAHPFYQGGFDLVNDARLLQNDIFRGNKELLSFE
jgi:GR25 family glycosyltransferase involved in LPS biosynthesis